MITDILRLIIRIAVVAAVAILAISAFWIVLAGVGVLLLGTFIYSKLTGKKLFHRTSYGNVRMVHFHPHYQADCKHSSFADQPHGRTHHSDLLSDVVEVIDAEDNRRQ